MSVLSGFPAVQLTEYPIDTRVIIDGAEAAIDGPDLAAGRLTVLDGLAFTWGRSTTVDQPDTGTCQFTMREQLLGVDADGDPTTDRPILDSIHVGSEVQIWARASYAAGSAGPAVTFPAAGDLDTSLWQQLGATQVTVNVARHLGRLAAWITPPTPTYAAWTAAVAFPLQPFAAVGQTPDAWDSQPRLLPGQTWEISGTIALPAGTVGHLAAYAYTAPYKGGAVRCTVRDATTGQPITLTGDYAWHSYHGTVQLPATFTDPDGAWIAPAIYLDTMPDLTTWANTPGLWTDAAWTWADRLRAGVQQLTLTPVGATARDSLIWAGQVTSLQAAPAGDHAIECTVSASDDAAPLANETIGDDPWPTQSVQARANRVMQLATTDTFTLTVDPALRDTQVAFRDVDAQPALGLLQDLAKSAGGVMWVATHAQRGTYLWMEDPNTRAAASMFVQDPATLMVTIGGNTRDTSPWSAADILLDPLTWSQDVADVITSVDVTWLQVIPGAAGEQTTTESQTVTVTDAAAARRYGIRKLTIDTELTSEVDATALANRALQQARATDWKLSGLTVDTRVLQRPLEGVDDAARTNIALDMLDGTKRLGMAVSFLQLPGWIPGSTVAATLYIEGGTYTITNGAWSLELLASPAGAIGHSVAWDEMPPATVTPTITWDDMDLSITWDDTYGVAAPAA